MAALFWLVVLGVIIWLLVRDNGSGINTETPETRLAERNFEWARFIKGYRNVAKTKTEKALVDRMLADIQEQGLVPATWDITEQPSVAVLRVQIVVAALTALFLLSMENIIKLMTVSNVPNKN